MSVVCQLAKDAKVEHDCERIAFRDEKEGLLRYVEQTLADKAEVKEKAGDVVARVQEEVWVFKIMKYTEDIRTKRKAKHRDTLLRLKSLVGIKVLQHL